MNNLLMQDELRSDEGERLTAYRDHLGFWTVGVGHLIDPARGANPSPFGVDLRNGGKITPVQSSSLLLDDIAAKMQELDRRIPWWRNMSENRQRVILNMAFQLGVNGLLAFKKAIAAMLTEDYNEAARQMKDSTWFKQTPNRAQRLIDRMVKG